MARLAKSPRRAPGVVLGAFMAVAIMAIGAAVTLAFLNPFGTETVDRSGPTVVEQIRDLNEFTAAEAEFVQDVDIEQDTKWVPDAIGGERTVAMVAGTVRATVDFSGLTDQSVTTSADGTTITVTLPEPVLQDADVHEDSTRIVSRQRGLINRVADFLSANPYDDGGLYRAAERKLNDAAAAADMHTTAQENTEAWVEGFLGAAGFEEVVVNWSTAPV